MRVIVLFLAALVLSGCGDSDSFTLYRNSPILPGLPPEAATEVANSRIHVPSFDTADGENYNQENCRIASELFAKQPGVTVRYWCEKGRYRK